ncbi:hypothetical protein [Krasilnikovia sp. M28-CT-15]|uniref:hypothetical protein n=1 Tax=Krasilnikovia sp. M28-CT-15 TaxID=3373540 RepID=UPI003875DAA8
MFTAPPGTQVDPAPRSEAAPVVPRSWRRWAPVLALMFASAIAGVWTTTAIRAAGRGFDITDEGFYLLSYRWWDADHRGFSGSQYVYGPLFALLDHDITGLRIARLASVLIAHLLFGVAFMRWLRPRRPDAPPTRLWEAAGAAVVVAAGGAVYAWFPQTPGYNDIVLLGALLALGAVFAMARQAERGNRVPAWLPVGFGALAVPVLLAKWAAVLALALVAAAAVIALAPGGPRAVLRAGAQAVAGTAVAAALTHLLVVPLTTAVPPIIEVNRLLAASSMPIPDLVLRYAVQTWPEAQTVVREYGLLVAAAVAAARARRPAVQVVTGLAGVAGLVAAARYTLRDGGLGGGPVNSEKFVVPMLATGVLAVLVAVAARAVDARGGALLGVLAVLPLIFAFGTSNIPLKVSSAAFAAWMAVLVAAVTGLDRRAMAARGLTGAVVVGALLVTACVATGGLWRHPYRDVPRDQATASVPGVPALAGVRIEPARARAYADLRARLAPYLTPPGRKVIALNKMAGIVLLLDGRTVGEGWYSPADPARTRAGIAAECAGGPPWQAGRAPILVLNRPVRAADNSLIQPCGLDLRAYRQLAPQAATGGFIVLVPR